MTAIATRFRSPVLTQIEAYQDAQHSWDACVIDHEAVQDCWALEDTTAVGLKCGEMLEAVTAAWRERVFRGTEPADDGRSAFYRGLHEKWLTVTDAILGRVATRLESDDVAEGAAALRATADRVRSAVAAWQAPSISMLVGLREISLPPDAAANLDRIITSAKSAPPTKPTGVMPKELSAQDFLALTKRS